MRLRLEALLHGAGAGGLRVLRVLLVRLEVIAVVAAVGLASWAAWDVGSVWGRAVLAGGLLFLGGGIGRFVREVRGE